MMCILLFVAALSPVAHAQSLAFERPSAKTEFTAYSPSNFISYHHRRNHSHNYYVGGIVGLSGCVVLWSGIFLYSIGSIQDYHAPHPNYGMQHAGIALMAAGGAMGIAGAVIGFRAKNEDKKRYGWRLVLPGYNELGVAYNF